MTKPKKYWAVVDEMDRVHDSGCPAIYPTEEEAEGALVLFQNYENIVGHRVIPVAIVPYDQAIGSITKADIMRAAQASTAKLKEIGAYKERSVMDCSETHDNPHKCGGSET